MGRVRVKGRAGVERVDVEAPTAEHPGDAREHAELVLDQDGKSVAHVAESWEMGRREPASQFLLRGVSFGMG